MIAAENKLVSIRVIWITALRSGCLSRTQVNKDASDRFIQQNIIKRLNDKTFKYKIEEVWLYEKGKVRKLKW
jgi:hypothetical protein